MKGHLHVALAAGDSRLSNERRGGLFVLSSAGGESWDRVIPVFNDNADAVAKTPAIACDTTDLIGSDKNPYRNRLYTSWIVESTENSSTQFSEVLFAKSVNGGNSFFVSMPEGFRHNPLRLNTGKASVSNPSIDVDESGKITVSWTEKNQDDGTENIVSCLSTNGGESFGRVVRSGNGLLEKRYPAESSMPTPMLESLRRSLKYDQDQSVRVAVLFAAAEFNADQSGVILEEGKNDIDPLVRQSAEPQFRRCEERRREQGQSKKAYL